MTSSNRNDVLEYSRLKNKTEPYTAEDLETAKQIAQGNPSPERIGFYTSVKRQVEAAETEME